MQIVTTQLDVANAHVPGYDVACFLSGHVAEQYVIQYTNYAAYVGDASCWAASLTQPAPNFLEGVVIGTSQVYRMVNNIPGANNALANPAPGGHAERVVVNSIISNNLIFQTVNVPPPPGVLAGVLYVELSPCVSCITWLTGLAPIHGISLLYVWYTYVHNADNPDINTQNLQALHNSYLNT